MNVFTNTHRLAARFVAVLAVFSLLMSMMPMQAFALDEAALDPINTIDQPLDKQGHVLICHSGNGKNYTDVNPDAESIVKGTSGHDNDSFDVIPAFYWNFDDESGFYEGKNWPSGKSIWDANCKNTKVGTGYITVVKAFEGERGPKSISDFTLEIDGEEVTSGEKNELAASKGKDKVANYVISESDIPANYSLVSISCVDKSMKVIASGAADVSFELKDEDDVTCTVTNKYTAPGVTKGSITVKKDTNDASGDAVDFDFTGTNGISAFSVKGDNADSEVIPSLAAGSYTITETDEAGWDFGSVTCTGADFVATTNGVTVTLDAVNNVVENATCTFTNTKEQGNNTTGTIIVDKVTVPSADAQSFAFTTTGTGYVGFNLTDTAAVNSQTVEAGSYSVAETAVAGWTQTNVSCVSSIQDTEVASALELDANETITCTFTNTKDGTPTIPGCTNQSATNYNRLATVDDGSCEYDYESVCVSPNTNLLLNGSFETPTVTANGGTWEIFANVADWTIGLSDGLELWKGLGIGASEGLQNAELDGNNATKITQPVATIPGATYELRFDFAARTADKADNNVNALVEGSVVENANSANTNWTTYGATFVATDASTEIGFEDIGTAQDNGGTGSLIDNAVVCLVDEPEPPQACELTVVSNITNTVDGNPAVLAVDPGPWVNGIVDSVAQWIWGDAPGSAIDPSTNESQVFTKTFNWNGPVTSATLQIAADNFYSVKLNGVEVATNGNSSNYAAITTVNLPVDSIDQGTNTLEITATNLANGATVLEGNPAGLIYDLTIVGNTSDDCTDTPDDGGGDNEAPSCELTASDTSIRRGADVELSWDITDLMTEGVIALLTNSEDEDEVDVDEATGSYEAEDIRRDTTYTLTVFGDFLDNESEGREVLATCDVAIDVRTSGGGGRRPSNDGDVAGDSTSRPEGQVLGEQVSVVPLGAADAGAGSTSPVALPTFGIAAMAFIGRSRQ